MQRKSGPFLSPSFLLLWWERRSQRQEPLMEVPHQDQRSRYSKPLTIHAFAHSGDLLSFQKLLRANPSLLNERNPVVWLFFITYFEQFILFVMVLCFIYWFSVNLASVVDEFGHISRFLLCLSVLAQKFLANYWLVCFFFFYY